MKTLLVLLFFGFASAFPREMLDVEGRKSMLGFNDDLGVQQTEDEIETELGKKLQKFLEQSEDAVGDGQEVDEILKIFQNEKGKRMIDALLDYEEEDRESRSIKDYWEKVKDYFRDLKIDLQEKYMKFGEWMKETFGDNFRLSKDKMENIQAIAKEFLRHAKNVSKEVGAEASEFFRQYKEELGNVWDELKDAFSKIRSRDR